MRDWKLIGIPAIICVALLLYAAFWAGALPGHSFLPPTPTTVPFIKNRTLTYAFTPTFTPISTLPTSTDMPTSTYMTPPFSTPTMPVPAPTPTIVCVLNPYGAITGFKSQSTMKFQDTIKLGDTIQVFGIVKHSEDVNAYNIKYAKGVYDKDIANGKFHLLYEKNIVVSKDIGEYNEKNNKGALLASLKPEILCEVGQYTIRLYFFHNGTTDSNYHHCQGIITVTP